MKKYLATLSPRNKIPKKGWDAALLNVRMLVYAEDTKEARETAIKVMENHKLFCKVVCIREIKSEDGYHGRLIEEMKGAKKK